MARTYNGVETALDIIDSQKVGEWVRLGKTNAEHCPQLGAPMVHGRIARHIHAMQPYEFDLRQDQEVTYIRRRPFNS